jgi:two-component system response regulator
MKKILIVEDEQALRDVYKTLFGFEKFEVYDAVNGKEAIKKLKALQPDVILLDILMPVMGGIEFLEKSNVKTTHPKTKILVLSNLSDPKTLNKITQLGATKYLLKSSASPAELVKAVRQLLG